MSQGNYPAGNSSNSSQTSTATSVKRFIQMSPDSPESYSIKIEATSFKSYLVNGVTIERKQLTNIDVILELPGDSATVGILMLEPSLIDSTPGTTIIGAELMRRLPIN